MGKPPPWQKEGEFKTGLLPGKLPPDILSRLLREEPIRDPRVRLGPGVGLDAAVLDMGDRYLIAKTDPITQATDLIGWYAVHINANDIACLGGKPRWFLATILLPESGAEEGQIQEIFRDIHRACTALEMVLVGGHTEVTPGLERLIVCGAMLGEAPKDGLVTPEGARPKDALVLTKGVPLEAVAILARELRGDLEGKFEQRLLDDAAGFLYEPGISVVRDAQVAMEAVSVHAFHDPTEGGLATAVHELAEASGLGAVVEAEQVPVLEAGRLFCHHLGLDPLGAFASGALLIALDPGDVPTLFSALQSRGIPAALIGELRERGEGLKLRERGKLRDLPLFTQDETGKVL